MKVIPSTHFTTHSIVHSFEVSYSAGPSGLVCERGLYLRGSEWSVDLMVQCTNASISKCLFLVLRGEDAFDDSIPLARAMQDDVMLAFLMNGEKLPKEHGFPLRLLVPGLYGIKNVKWIVEIEAYAGDYKGYWQRKGWTDDGTIKTFSRIDSPGHYQTLRGAEQRFRGIAFGGPNSISRVEISLDAARTWDSCEIETPMSPYSWVIWNYTWRPKNAASIRLPSVPSTARANYKLLN